MGVPLKVRFVLASMVDDSINTCINRIRYLVKFMIVKNKVTDLYVKKMKSFDL